MYRGKVILILIALMAIVFTASIATVQAATTSSNGIIYGAVFNDANHNGIHDNNEGGVQGVTIQVLDSSGGLAAQATTDVNGYYQISLKPGSYVVKDVLPNGYVNTMPSTVNTIVQSNTNSKANFLISKTTQPVSNGIIYGAVFNDTNRNGLHDTGEFGVPGVTVQVFDGSGGLAAKTTTDVNGHYNISIKPGSYVVKETVPNGYVNTTPASVATTVQSDRKATIDFGNVKNTNLLYNVAYKGVKPGMDVQVFYAIDIVATFEGKPNVHFAIVNDTTMTIFTLCIPLKNNVASLTNNEFLINYSQFDTYVKSIETLSSCNARQVFTERYHGDYIQQTNTHITSQSNRVNKFVTTSITAVQPNGASQTITPAEPLPGYSDFTSGKLVATTTNDINNKVLHFLFGYSSIDQILNSLSNGSVQGVVFNDTNRNGRLDSNEKGVPGVTVQVFYASCGLAGETKTDKNGHYEISLKPGNYIVEEVVPSGYVNTTPTSVSTTVQRNKETTINFGISNKSIITGTETVYVANTDSNTVSVIDTATNKVASILAGINPVGVAVSPNGAVYEANTGDNTVSVVFPGVFTQMPAGRLPEGVAVSPNGKSVYVTNTGDNTVSVIDTATNKGVATIPAGRLPEGVAVSPNGKSVYVTNAADNTVSVIDTSNNKVVDTIPVGTAPSRVAVSPNGKRAYVTNTGRKSVSVIDTATNKVVDTIPVGTVPIGVAVLPNGKRAYVANTGDNTVSVIDTATNKVLATIPAGKLPEGVAVSPNGARAYVTNTGSNTVTVIDPASNIVIGTINVGDYPMGIAVSPTL